MSSDQAVTVVLCGAFTTLSADARARLASAGFQVVSDPSGDTLARSPGGPGARIAVCDADALGPEGLTALIRRAAGAGVPALVVGSSAHPERIIAGFRAGAADYLVWRGPADVGALVARLVELRAAGGEPPAAVPVAELRRLVAKLEHDVKNPIGNILGYVDILREGLDTPPEREQVELLQRIERNCNQALELLAHFAEAASRLR